MPAVPLELVELIVSFLHRNSFDPDKSYLNVLDGPVASAVAKCGLVCRGWVPASRRLLYYCVQIRKSNAYALAKLFRNPTRLTFVSHVRQVSLTGGIAEDRWMRTVFDPKIAVHLPHAVYMLSLDASLPNSPPSGLPIISLAGIAHLEIEGRWDITLAEIVTCVASFPALETLDLGISKPLKDLALPVPTPSPPKTLGKVQLSSRFGVIFGPLLLQWIQSSADQISNLEFWIPIRDSFEAHVASSLACVSSIDSSLRALTLRFSFPLPDSDDIVAVTVIPDNFLQANSQLRSLALTCINSTPPQTLNVLHKLLADPRTLPALQRLVIIFVHESGVPELESEFDYGALDQLIASRTHIRYLSITSLRGENDWKEITWAEEVPKSAMPLCAARGNLIMKIS